MWPVSVPLLLGAVRGCVRLYFCCLRVCLLSISLLALRAVLLCGLLVRLVYILLFGACSAFYGLWWSHGFYPLLAWERLFSFAAQRPCCACAGSYVILCSVLF